MTQVTPYFFLYDDCHIFWPFYFRAISLNFFCSCRSLLLLLIISVDCVSAVTSWVVSSYHSSVHLKLLSLFKRRLVLTFCRFWQTFCRLTLRLLCENVVLIMLVEMTQIFRSRVPFVKFALFVEVLCDSSQGVLICYPMARVEFLFWVRKILIHITLRMSQSIFLLISIGEANITFWFRVESPPRVQAFFVFYGRWELILILRILVFEKISCLIKSFLL